MKQVIEPGGSGYADIAVAKDGTIYVADTAQGRVLRLKKGATALDVWASDPVVLATVDGLAILDDGALRQLGRTGHVDANSDQDRRVGGRDRQARAIATVTGA